MSAALDIAPTNIVPRAAAYADIYDEYVVDAAFLWGHRTHQLNQPHYTREEMAALEQRIEDQLEGLLTSMEAGWAACDAALDLHEPGETFTAAIVAWHSHDIPNIQKVVQAGLANKLALKGLVSALGWLPGDIVQPWIGRLLSGKDLRHKYLGLAACSVRREDPGDYLTALLHREDCRRNAPLYARACRLIGEVRRPDLLPALLTAQASGDDTVRFWALWSARLLGHPDAVTRLQPYVHTPGPHQHSAMQLCFRALPLDQARAWISTLSQNPQAIRSVIRATGILGDPQAIHWLITKMADPRLARLAGEAWTNITGIDLAPLAAHPPPTDSLRTADDPPEEVGVAMHEDDPLPWPDVEKVTTLWHRHAPDFSPGQRYFLGQAITQAALQHTLATGYPRQRHAAALELALLGPSIPLVNTHAKVIP